MVARITVVTGPPGAGKSTYVQKRVKPGDVVIDFDVLAQALGSPDPHDHPPRLRQIAGAAWWAAVSKALSPASRGLRVWIIDSSPLPARLRAYTAARALIVTLTADTAELAERTKGRNTAYKTAADQHFAGRRRRQR